MDYTEKNLRGKLEGLDLKSDQIDDIINDVLADKPVVEVKDGPSDGKELLDLELKIQQEKDPMAKARMIAFKISHKIDNYLY